MITRRCSAPGAVERVVTGKCCCGVGPRELGCHWGPDGRYQWLFVLTCMPTQAESQLLTCVLHSVKEFQWICSLFVAIDYVSQALLCHYRFDSSTRDIFCLLVSTRVSLGLTLHDWNSIQQDCFLQKEARVCVSNAFVIEDSKFKWCFCCGSWASGRGSRYANVNIVIEWTGMLSEGTAVWID